MFLASTPSTVRQPSDEPLATGLVPSRHWWCPGGRGRGAGPGAAPRYGLEILGPRDELLARILAARIARTPSWRSPPESGGGRQYTGNALRELSGAANSP